MQHNWMQFARLLSIEPQPSTTFYNLDCHETTPPTNIITYQDVDRLVSASAEMFEYVNPSNMGLLDLNWRYTLEVPLRYQNIHFTVAQCSFPRLLINRLTTQTTYVMFGLLQSKAYIKPPIVEA